MQQGRSCMHPRRVNFFVSKECTQGGCTSLAQGARSTQEQVFVNLKCTFSLKCYFSFFVFFCEILRAFSVYAWKHRLVSKSIKVMSSPNHGLDNISTSKG